MIDPPLTIELETAGQVTLHSPHPIRVRVRNHAATAISMIGVVDGSEAGARFPRWRAIVDGPRGRHALPETHDMIRPLLPVDIVAIAPGAAFDPTARDGGANYFPLSAFEAITDQPGEYRAVLELDTCAASIDAWLGDPIALGAAAASRDEVKRRLDQIPRLRARSNEVIVVVT